MSAAGVVIVGGGLAGARTAQTLRSLGFADPIRLLAGEDAWPYDRPPLSKEFLAGEAEQDGLCLLDAATAERLDIEVTRGQPATSVDMDERELLLADGSRVPFAQLVVATGARPRTLPQLAGVENVFTLRDVGDARALRSALEHGGHVVVIGGGFIGLEVASVARARGCEVTVVEAASEPMSAAVGPQLGRAIGDWHSSHGVRLLCERTLVSAETQGALTLITLSDGTSLAADAVVLAVGVRPEVGWLAGTPLASEDGVPCDSSGRTALAGVFAAGDVARPEVHGRRVAVGHWTPANDMARRVAGALSGAEDDERELDDYFWSDQFGARLQLAGSVHPDGEIVVESGAIDDWSFMASCRVEGSSSAIFAMNRPRDFVRARLKRQGALA
jgi:3-phenylpropionate/trans-cinnamate dioxygenase ferredoxin reductase component